MPVGEQLNKVLNAKGMSIAQLAKTTGIPKTTLYSLRSRSGGSVKPTTLAILSQCLGVPIGFFMSEENVPTQDIEIYEDRLYSNLAGMDLYTLPAGSQMEDVTTKLIARLSRNVIALQICDASMDPEYCQGDVVFVNRSQKTVIGEVGLFEYDGQALIRSYGTHYLIPANTLFPILPLDAGCHCTGAVIGKIRL